jgi:hypothetical protein
MGERKCNENNIKLSNSLVKNRVNMFGYKVDTSEMVLLIKNPRMPSHIQGNLVISGWIKGGKVKEKGRES